MQQIDLVNCVSKLKELKRVQHAIDAKEIIEINDRISSKSLGTTSDSGQNNTSSTLPTQMPTQNAPTTGGKQNENIYIGGGGGSGVPEPANGALGGGAFSTWP